MSYLKQYNDGLLRFEVHFEPKTTSYLLAAYDRSSGEYKWYHRICGRQYQCWKTGKLFGEAFPNVRIEDAPLVEEAMRMHETKRRANKFLAEELRAQLPKLPQR
jgi:hypothetical protein